MNQPNRQANIRRGTESSLQNRHACPTDTDIYYDARDDVCCPTEGCPLDSCPIPTSNRTRPTQNDRDRDHSNLSKQPNTEACAGQTQPSAGRNSNRHAKDNNDTCYDNNDHSDDDEEEEEDGQTCECRTTRDGVFTEHCDGSCIRRQNDEDAKPIKTQSNESFLAKTRETASSLKQSNQTHDAVETREEPLSSARSTECLRTTRPAAVCSNEISQTKEDYSRIEPASKIESEDRGCLPKSFSDMLLAPRPCLREQLREIKPVDGNAPPSELQGAVQPPSESATTSLPPTATHSESAVQETAQTGSDQILPLLQSIYEVVRCIRDEKLQSTAARVDAREPPWTPSTPLQCGTMEELCHVTEFRRSLDIETMALLEPPERDTDCTSTSKPRRLVPVDKDLLQNIDWEMEQSVETTLQGLPTLSSNQADPQSGQDDFTSAATEAETFLKSTEALDCTATPCEEFPKDAESEIVPNAAQFLHCSSEKLQEGENYCSKKARCEAENSKRTNTSSDSVSDESIRIIASATAFKPSKPQFLLKPTEIASLDNLPAPPSTSDVGTDRPDFADKPCCCSVVCSNRQADILEATRSNAKYHFSSISSCHDRWKAASTDLSFPASIEKVHELGRNSLFVKWKVHSLKNVAGYEIFLDGTLTNRYYSRIHRAAVICNVDLEYPHRIILRALPPAPKRCSPLSKSSITSKDRPLAATTPGAYCPKTNGTITWYPSVYHFEPTLSPATVSFDYNGCCASQS